MEKTQSENLSDLCAAYAAEAKTLEKQIDKSGDDIRRAGLALARLQMRHTAAAYGVQIGSLIKIGAKNLVEPGEARVVGFGPNPDGGFDPAVRPKLRVMRRNIDDGTFSGRTHFVDHWTVIQSEPYLTNVERAVLILLRAAEDQRLSVKSLQQDPARRDAASGLIHLRLARRSDRHVVLNPGA